MEKYQISFHYVRKTDTDWTLVSECGFVIIAIGSFLLLAYLNYKNSIGHGAARQINDLYTKWHLEDEIKQARDEREAEKNKHKAFKKLPKPTTKKLSKSKSK
ncbi:unnamed protein product [Caenorhabditis angaria]|uniref:Uncharacterized protein n=1 Tax=Caenorhabditis angaria TaxID=860376 RepID=A0A9P1N606_9PELO|nr:unnamed protein product [Caenorhabditis angaria]